MSEKGLRRLWWTSAGLATFALLTAAVTSYLAWDYWAGAQSDCGTETQCAGFFFLLISFRTLALFLMAVASAATIGGFLLLFLSLRLRDRLRARSTRAPTPVEDAAAGAAAPVPAPAPPPRGRAR